MYISLLSYFKENYWTPDFIFKFVLTFAWITFFWDLYITLRQYNLYKCSTKLPTELSGVLNQETFSKARHYNIDKTKFGCFYNLWNQLLSSAILLLKLFPLLWNVSGNVLTYFDFEKSHEILRTIIFLIIGSFLSSIMDLPWSIYNTFVVESKHGFNKQTPSFYAKDKIKKFILSQAISSPIVAMAIYIIKIGGEYFFIYLWLFCSFVIVFYITIYADYIAPLFDNYTPLPNGELRDQIESLASSLKFPLKKLFVVEGSKRSSHSNAYLYGFYNNKRIVLFDTLIEDYQQMCGKGKEQDEINNQLSKKNDTENENEIKTKSGCNKDEILAVLSHELGHWKLNHSIINLIISEVQMFLTFAIFQFLYRDPVIYQSFGFSDQPIFIGLYIIFQFIFSPYNEVLSFLMICLSRHFEFAADAFAKKLNRASDLRSALIKLNIDNLGFPVYDWLYSAFNLSHPPLLERIKALGKLD